MSLQSFTDRKKQPFSKPIPKSFQTSWNTDEPERGVKRSFESSRVSSALHVQPTKENQPPPAPSIPLALLQQQALAIVARGQIIPILPSTPLHQSLISGENAVKDVLMRELNIGSQNNFNLGPPQMMNQNQNYGGNRPRHQNNWDRGGRNNWK